MEEIKYVIKNTKTSKYLSPYNYGSHWVDINSAQRFNIETNKETINDLVDFIWIENEEVELIKVNVVINVKEIEKNEIEIKKKEFILSREEYVELKQITNSLRNVVYSKHGTKLMPFKIVHHIVYNLIKDNYYLRGIELGRKKFFLTHSNILLAKNTINDDQKLKKELATIYKDLFDDKKIDLIQKKLKKQMEN